MGPGPNDRGASRYHILREVECSLRRLGTDRIDVYLLHSFDADTPLEEQLRALDDLVRQGKVRYVGVCNYQAWQVCRALWVQDRINASPRDGRRRTTLSRGSTWARRYLRRAASRATNRVGSPTPSAVPLVIRSRHVSGSIAVGSIQSGRSPLAHEWQLTATLVRP
jgi:aryl-alcohol dehydrogenase-like predicted oxidoreductase